MNPQLWLVLAGLAFLLAGRGRRNPSSGMGWQYNGSRKWWEGSRGTGAFVVQKGRHDWYVARKPWYGDIQVVGTGHTTRGAAMREAERLAGGRDNPYRSYPGPPPTHALFGRLVGRYWWGADPPAEVVEARKARRKPGKGQSLDAQIEALRKRREEHGDLEPKPGDFGLHATYQEALTKHVEEGRRIYDELQALERKREAAKAPKPAAPAALKPAAPAKPTETRRDQDLNTALNNADYQVIKQNDARDEPLRGTDLLEARAAAQARVIRETSDASLTRERNELMKSMRYGAGDRLLRDINAELDRRKHEQVVAEVAAMTPEQRAAVEAPALARTRAKWVTEAPELLAAVERGEAAERKAAQRGHQREPEPVNEERLPEGRWYAYYDSEAPGVRKHDIGTPPEHTNVKLRQALDWAARSHWGAMRLELQGTEHGSAHHASESAEAQLAAFRKRAESMGYTLHDAHYGAGERTWRFRVEERPKVTRERLTPVAPPKKAEPSAWSSADQPPQGMSRAEFERRLRPRPIGHGYAVRQDVAGPGWTLIYPSGETRTGHATRAAAEKRADEHRRVSEPTEHERELRRELSELETLAPRFSEGAISPTQFNRMSDRQRTKYDRDMQRRYAVEDELRELRKSPEQRAAEASRRASEAAEKKRRERLMQVESEIRFRESVHHRGIGGTVKRNREIYEGLLREREQLQAAAA